MLSSQDGAPVKKTGEPRATIGILRECKNKWERRCSLTPTEVYKLVHDDGFKVIVQSSTTRCYSDEEFAKAGAIIQEDMQEAGTIFGVKEVPIEHLLAGKTYFFFSHTIKAQEYNMPLLDQLLAQKVRMVDFECIKEAPQDPDTSKQPQKQLQRLVAFGRYAGIAGAFDFLRGCGEFLLQRGYQTPLIFIGSSYMYEDFEAMKDAMQRVSKGIIKGGLPKRSKPFVFGVTGSGRVSSGVIEILELLPHHYVSPPDLKDFIENYEKSEQNCNQIIICQFQVKDLFVLKDNLNEIGGQEFDKSHFYSNPHLYKSVFTERFLPYLTFLLHGIYYEPKYPRILTINDLKKAQLTKNDQGEKICQLMGVCDISADFEGSLELTRRFTSIEEPFLLFDATEGERGTFKEKISEAKEGDNSILYHCVDHLPAEMPKEASNHFGQQLYPFIARTALSDSTGGLDQQQSDLPPEIFNALICCNGELTPNFFYISRLRKVNQEAKDRNVQIIDESENQNDQDSKDMQIGSKVLKRNLSMVNVGLAGHLFDTRCFNDCIDICEKYSVQFRIVSWNIGMDATQTSNVTIQMMASDKDNLFKAVDLIQQTAIKLGIQLLSFGDSAQEDNEALDGQS